MNEQEQKNKIKADIKDLASKLLHESTKEIKHPNTEKERRTKVRQMKNRLKELVEIYKLIFVANKIILMK